MLSTRKRSFDTPLWDNPSLSALERIRLLDNFTMAHEKRLHDHADDIFSLVAPAGYWAQDMGYETTMDDAAHQDTPPTPIGVTHSMPPPRSEPDDQRAAKRRWQSNGEAPTSVGSSDPYAYYSPFFDSVSGRPPSDQPYTPATNTAQPGGSRASSISNNHPPSILNQATTGPAVAYGPSHNSLSLENPDPRSLHQADSLQHHPTHYYMADGAHSQASGTASVVSALASAEIDSHTNTSLTQTPLSGHSHVNSFSVAEGSSQVGTMLNNAAESVISTVLQADPMVISPTERTIALKNDRLNFTWSNWEMNTIMQHILGLDAPDDRCLIALDTKLSPKDPKALDDMWGKLSVSGFLGRRSATTIARKWWLMIDIFCRLVVAGSTPQFDTLPIVLDKIMQIIRNPSSPPIEGVKTQEMIAWTANGRDGWIGMAYKIRNHSLIVNRIADLHASNQPPSSRRSISRLPRRARSTRSGSSVDHSPLSHGAMHPWPASAPGSLRQLTQVSESLIEDTPAPAVPHNTPATAEMVRNHHAITVAEVKMVEAKAIYIRAYADQERYKLYREFITLQMTAREQARRAAHEVLMLPNPTDEMRLMAQGIYFNQMNSTLPTVDVREILHQLEISLPSLRDLGIPSPTTPPFPEELGGLPNTLALDILALPPTPAPNDADGTAPSAPSS
ncbi:hypothetical protein BDV93DRAFT_607083 [Ceratobasidium sp. AG-I]|nr:hypothetical protein BDV93DRAFT_607083 [Ceratobasidium sp. AG-I]